MRFKTIEITTIEKRCPLSLNKKKKGSFEHVSEGLNLRAIIPDIGKLNSF